LGDSGFFAQASQEELNLNNQMYDLIIIGGGPAGLTAAIYAARQKLDTLLVTKEFGGQMAKKEVEIENYPGLGSIAAADLIAKFRDHVKALGIQIKQVGVKGIQKTGETFKITTDDGDLESRTVLVATGADPRHMNVLGEDEFMGKGVCYCANCDAPLFSGRTVAVIGGGNAAFEAAIFCARFAKKIYMIEFGDTIRADAANQEILARSGKAEIITRAKIVKVNGDKFVNGLTYQDIRSGKNVDLVVEGIFVKIGYAPASGFVKDLVVLNNRAEIVYDHETMMAKTPGLFCAGDVTDIKYKQIIIACGEGAKAVLSIRDYLKSNL
jgi:thioredoxin-disulfide reductase